MRHLNGLSDRLLGLVAPKITAAAGATCTDIGACYAQGLTEECCCVFQPGVNGATIVCTKK